MRKLLLMLCTVVMAVEAGNGIRFVAAETDGIGVYRNRTRQLFETPLFTVGTADRLLVVEAGDSAMKIRSASGATGWVERNRMRTVSSRSIVFGNTAVDGYIDTPDMLVITDGSEPAQGAIRLERSFRDNLAENLDRETALRLAR